MTLYAYRCASGHRIDREFPLGKAARTAGMCDCGTELQRYFGPDVLPQIAATDPFRAFDLSPRKEKAQVEQQRAIDAPRDRIEANRMERDLGRTYVGDDTSMMSKPAQRGIAAWKDKKRAGFSV